MRSSRQAGFAKPASTQFQAGACGLMHTTKGSARLLQLPGKRLLSSYLGGAGFCSLGTSFTSGRIVMEVLNFL
jgi:hypothetical protein